MTENGVVEAEGKSIYGSKRETTTRLEDAAMVVLCPRSLLV